MKDQDNIKISIGLCTAKRPIMLSDCLESLRKQKIYKNIELTLIVVENDQFSLSKDIVKKAKEKFSYPIYYFKETKLGIPFARNRVIEEAIKLNSDWIAFLDDDELAEENWINELYLEAVKYQADVLEGVVIPLYPEPAPFWLVEKKKKYREDGEETSYAATGNVLLSKKIYVNANLRFDESMAFSGGEDSDFFYRTKLAGFKIVFSRKPGVKEVVPQTRLTYIYQVKRAARVAANSSRIRMNRNSTGKIYVKYIVKSLIKLAGGLATIVLIPFSVLLGIKAFKKIALKAGKDLGSSFGIWVTILRKMPEPYKKIEGR